MTESVAVVGGTHVTWPGAGPVRDEALAAPEVTEDGALRAEAGRFVEGDGDAETTIDATGCTVVPGFVDCHTHLPFFGWRADEDAARLSGVRYETLHGREGGIFRSARLLSEAPDDRVLAFSIDLARQMLAAGTTTFETKSGYGLSVDDELRQLRLARRLAGEVPQRVVTTCLAAHAVPRGRSEGEWIGVAADELLPQAAAGGLATACDLYVETIAFALEHAARLHEAARSLGMRMRVHADQLSDGQTAAFAARWGFDTADHLNHSAPDAVGDLAQSETVAVLLPGATFTLRQAKKPPARDLLGRGAIVALGSDLNPGTSPVHSMPFVIALACRLYGFRPLEALAAATVNAAAALGLGDEVGRLAPGYRADAVVLDVSSLDHLAYRPDRNPVGAVVCEGRLVHVAEGFEGRVRRGFGRGVG
ncbi:MAG TPA: imidazolonepropionase [Actinomycetota bacterium]|nr:imidazolonepropionase [Actinomycetota bacterium]